MAKNANADFTPERAVANSHIQTFDRAQGKRFHKVELWIETDAREEPAHWQWDALVNPNRVKVHQHDHLADDEVVRSGFVDPTAGPDCETCLDRKYVLMTVSPQDLALAQAYYAYVAEAWRIEPCPECNSDEDALSYSIQKRAWSDFVRSSRAMEACRVKSDQYFRVHYVPDPRYYKLHAWTPDGMTENKPAFLLRGEEDCYPDQFRSDVRDRNRRNWAATWGVDISLPTKANKAKYMPDHEFNTISWSDTKF